MPEPDEKRSIIATRIREARKMAGLSQAQVAKLLGLHRPSVSELEAGNRRASAEELSRLAKVLEVSVSWLAGEGEDKLDVFDTRVQLAARELSKLKPDDLDRLMSVLATLRSGDNDK